MDEWSQTGHGAARPLQVLEDLFARGRTFPVCPIKGTTSSQGGGTYAALPGLETPIQFWLFRNSPGSLLSPLPFDNKTRWMSTKRHRKVLTQLLQSKLECSNIARHFLYIIQWDSRHLLAFKQQQVEGACCPAWLGPAGSVRSAPPRQPERNCRPRRLSTNQFAHSEPANQARRRG